MPKANVGIHKRNNSYGFTLVELLTVVAIIAVLVAIAIPIFNKQFENARNRTDVYNAKAMGDAIQIYYMNHPEKIAELESVCKTAPNGYVQICVGPVNTSIDLVLKDALIESGLLPKQVGYRYDLKAQSKINWFGYYIAVAGPNKTSPDGVRIEFVGIPPSETKVPTKHYASYFWPNCDPTEFNNYIHGIA